MVRIGGIKMVFSFALLCVMIVSAHAYRPGDVSSFFLKAPKSVPRAGRAAPESFESFFLKASKSVPRVGRRDGTAQPDSADSFYQPWTRAEDYNGLKTQQPGQLEYWQNSADTQNEHTPNTEFPEMNEEMARNFYNYLSELSGRSENQDESHGQRRNRFLQEKDSDTNMSRQLEDAKYQRHA